MTVSIQRPNWSGLRERVAGTLSRITRGRGDELDSAPADATQPDASTTAGRQRGDLNTGWVLPAMLLVVCLVATGWLFAHGSAATAWLIALIVIVIGGVPIGLVLLRLFGYEDAD
jgi:hypothetical protein